MTRAKVPAPPYPEAHGLLAGKTVLVTAAAGTGIGFATARRCAEEGARVMLSDLHERRLGESAAELAKLTGQKPPTQLCDVTNEAQVQALVKAADRRARPHRRAGEQRRASAATRRSSR